MKKQFTAVSIYSGGGGIDLGFHKAGFNIILSTDNWAPACDTLKKNFPKTKVECEDIRKINFKKIIKELGVKEIDCLMGGPPCPAYSKSRFYRKEKKRALEDENSFTLYEYFRVLEELRPKTFLFENVHGFTYKPHIAALNYLKKMSDKLGYNIYYKVVNAALYGIPQTRERFLCVGVRKDLPDFVYPTETHYNPEKHNKKSDKDKKKWLTCGQVISDLDFDLDDDKNLQAGSKHKELLKQIPPGDNYLFFTRERGFPNPKFKWRSRYWSFLLKLSPNRPSWTIQASQSNNMGPFHWKNRFLRINEIKRIQTFDDDYIITGNYKTQWRQIGNAVPPNLARLFAEEIKNQILTKKKKTNL